MRLAQRYRLLIDYFIEHNPEAASELKFDSPYQLLIAVMLSAQCTDKRVNMVTPALFERYPGPAELSQASFEELFPYIQSISYPNAKCRHLIESAKRIMEEFDGSIPSCIEELMTLPGVGRKTANVVASIIYNEPVIAVDTHVFRVSHRIGLSKGKNPREVELDLERHIPTEYRAVSHHWLILHGRYVCTALKPKCKDCGICGLCEYYQSQN